MNLDKRQKRLAIIALVAVGLFVGDRIVFSPLINSWKERSKRITKLKQDVRDGTETLNRESKLRAQWDRMRTNTLPAVKSEAEGKMLKAFERWARDGGVSVSSVRPQWKEAQDEYKTLECRADIGGNISSVARFLYQIERDPLGVKVDSMEITSRNTDGSQLAMVVQVSGLLINPPKKTGK